MRETETKATAFAAPMWLERVFKCYHLEPGGLRRFHKPSWISPSKILSTPLQKDRSHGFIDGHMQCSLGPPPDCFYLKFSFLLSAHSWGLMIYNMHLSQLPSFICFKHLSQVQHLRTPMTDKLLQHCTVSHWPRPAHGCPEPPYAELPFTLANGRDRERKNLKYLGNSPRPFHLCCYNVRLATHRSKCNFWSHHMKEWPFPSLGCSLLLCQWDFK